MPKLFLPADLKSVAGRVEFDVDGTTVDAAINHLEQQIPGVRDRLCDGSRLRSGLAVAVDGHLSTRGLKTAVSTDSEIHFLPAIGGG